MFNLFRPSEWFSTHDVHVELDPTTEPDSVKQPSVVLIHGANASTLTYAYLRGTLSHYNYINIDYSPHNGFEKNLASMVQILKNSGPVYIIGHSLGGIYAMHLSQHIDAIGGVTISSPHGGSRTADWARYMAPGYQIFKEVGTKSKPILAARKFTLPGHWTNLVGTDGSVPWHAESNDGVLTLSSMTLRTDIPTTIIKANHYEIVCHADTIKHIQQEIQTAIQFSKKKKD